MKPVIDADELLRNCFSSKTMKRVKIGKVRRGPYVARLSWGAEGLPYGEQIIWIMYSPKSRSQLDRLADDVTALMRKVDGKVIFIDDFAPERLRLPLEIMLLSDGHLTYNVMTPTLKSGETGHVAIFVGQGRSIDVNDPDIPGALHTIVANLFHVKELRDDPIIKAGMEKLRRLQEAAVKLGAKPGYLPYRPRRRSPR